jgi:hypothetical protein
MIVYSVVYAAMAERRLGGRLGMLVCPSLPFRRTVQVKLITLVEGSPVTGGLLQAYGWF